MYPNNNNNNNNNIIIIIIIIIKGKSKTAGGICGFGRERAERDFFFIFFLFTSFSDLRKSDRKFLSGLKAKLIYTTKVTRGHHKVGV